MWSSVVICFPSHKRTLVWLSGQFSTVPVTFLQNKANSSPSSRVTKQSIKWYWVCKGKNPGSMPTHIVHGWLSYCTVFPGRIGYLMQATGIDDIMVAVEVCIRRTANMVIFGKDYYAMLHIHTTVLASLFTIHLKALARWLISEEKYFTYMSMHACLHCPSTPRCPV